MIPVVHVAMQLLDRNTTRYVVLLRLDAWHRDVQNSVLLARLDVSAIDATRQTQGARKLGEAARTCEIEGAVRLPCPCAATPHLRRSRYVCLCASSCR
jgi:hypothetical protein